MEVITVITPLVIITYAVLFYTGFELNSGIRYKATMTPVFVANCI